MKKFESYRSVLGQKLREFRESRGLSAYKVAKDGGLTITQVKVVEDGTTNYTVDTLLAYIAGSDLYMYFAERETPEGFGHNFDELAQKAVENDPYKKNNQN